MLTRCSYLGWWLADPRWCSSKVSFWCWQVLIHFPFLVRFHQPPGALCGKDRGSAGSVAVFDISNSIASKKTNHISRSFCSSGFELILHLVLSNLSLVTYQFQSRCCLVIQEHCYMINQAKSDIPLIFPVYEPFRSFSALRKCIPRRSQGDQNPFFRSLKEIKCSFEGFSLQWPLLFSQVMGAHNYRLFWGGLGRWFSFSLQEHKAPMFLIHTGPTYSTVLV